MNALQTKTGAASVMVARAAQWNMSVFRQAGLLRIDDVITEYLKVQVLNECILLNLSHVETDSFRWTTTMTLATQNSAFQAWWRTVR